jgi:hypothetical protein
MPKLLTARATDNHATRSVGERAERRGRLVNAEGVARL